MMFFFSFISFIPYENKTKIDDLTRSVHVYLFDILYVNSPPDVFIKIKNKTWYMKYMYF